MSKQRKASSCTDRGGEQGSEGMVAVDWKALEMKREEIDLMNEDKIADTGRLNGT